MHRRQELGSVLERGPIRSFVLDGKQRRFQFFRHLVQIIDRGHKAILSDKASVKFAAIKAKVPENHLSLKHCREENRYDQRVGVAYCGAVQLYHCTFWKLEARF